MGRSSYRKVIVLALLFGLASIFIYWERPSRAVRKEKPLSEALLRIEGWQSSGVVPLDKELVEGLELDEYANQNYFNGRERVFLYIGYYLSKKKLGAAHDPLVCFPGQGWVASDKKEGKVILDTDRDSSISYSSMIVQRGLQREFVLYWFQSYDRTASNTFSQKTISLRQRILRQREDNAFVRISIPVGKKSLEECREILTQFIKSFYPVFLNYVTG
jgi:EpsI family protein